MEMRATCVIAEVASLFVLGKADGKHRSLQRAFSPLSSFRRPHDAGVCPRPKDRPMKHIHVAAIAGLGMTFMAAPAMAGLASVTGPKWVKPDSQVEQVRYRHRRNILPEALIGGVISGVLGGVVGGNCYFNDCGYDNGPYYGGTAYYGGDGYDDGGGYVGGYGGGGYGGGGRVRGIGGGGRGGGGGVRMSHAAMGGGHIGGGGGGHVGGGGGGGHAGGGGHGGRR
jgi:hypothetical protein